VIWLWTGIAFLVSVPVLLITILVALHVHLRIRYLPLLPRIFQEKPLFVIPRGEPVAGAEEVSFSTTNGLQLRGCYLRARTERRRGVILFGLEFGSNRWACVPYCEHLLDAGYDVFTYEPRGQGDSPIQPGYEPLQWVTDFEIEDAQAAVNYLKGRPDADPRGVGFFGISKGGGAGVFVGAKDAYLRCFVTDGIFATYSTMVPYMRKWYGIYNDQYAIQGLLPLWYYGLIGVAGLRLVEKERKCHFPYMEKVICKLAPRPLLMIHGGGDTYVKPDVTEGLFALAREPKEFWLVEGAKHNQAMHVAREEYQRRVLEFFDKHLGSEPQEVPAPVPPALAKTP
jgi:pimeloyl-ACP methyl ester carboxylesterase